MMAPYLPKTVKTNCELSRRFTIKIRDFAFPANTDELRIGQPSHYGKPSNFILKYHVMPEKLRLKIDLDKGGQCPLFYYRQQVGPEVDLFVIQSELIS